METHQRLYLTDSLFCGYKIMNQWDTGAKVLEVFRMHKWCYYVSSDKIGRLFFLPSFLQLLRTQVKGDKHNRLRIVLYLWKSCISGGDIHFHMLLIQKHCKISRQPKIRAKNGKAWSSTLCKAYIEARFRLGVAKRVIAKLNSILDIEEYCSQLCRIIWSLRSYQTCVASVHMVHTRSYFL